MQQLVYLFCVDEDAGGTDEKRAAVKLVTVALAAGVGAGAEARRGGLLDVARGAVNPNRCACE